MKTRKLAFPESALKIFIDRVGELLRTRPSSVNYCFDLNRFNFSENFFLARRSGTSRTTRVYTSVFLCALTCISVITETRGDEIGNRLITVDPFSETNDGAEYKALYERKLFVTNAEVARFVSLPGNVGTERTVAVYRLGTKQTSLPGNYWVTATETSAKLWPCISVPGQTRPTADPHTIKVRRDDAPLPASTAQLIHDVWLAMLVRKESPSTHIIRGDSTTLIFSAVDSRGILLRAQADSLKGNTKDLWGIGEDLIEYCRLPAAKRSAHARKLEKDARRLLKHVTQTPET